jgi:PAS domain S-box-containing protein
MSSILPQLLRRLITHIPLRWGLIIPFVLSTITTVMLIGYLSYRSGEKAVEDLGHQLVAQSNHEVTQRLKDYLQMPPLVNRLNVDAVEQGYLNPENIPALELFLFHRLQQFSQVSAILFASPDGTFRFVERFPTSYLGAADPARPDYIRIYALDNQGKRGQLAHEVHGLDVRRDRPFYQRAVTTGRLGWNPIARYGNSSTLTLDASQPVYEQATKRLLGAFAVHLRLEDMSEFLRQLEISRAGQVLIMDQNGALLATSTSERPYSTGDKIRQPHQFQQLKIYQSQNGLTRALGEYLRSHAALSPNQAQYLEFSYQSKLHYVQITPFQDQYGLDWRILTVIPKSHFLQAIQSNLHITVLLCLLTLAIAILLGLLAAEQLTTRFAQLNRASRELAVGNLDQQLPTNHPIYELNALARTFNQMAAQLKQSFAQIQTALEESEQKFTTIFRTSPAPLKITSLPEEHIVDVNDSYLKSFGYSRQEVIGRTALELEVWLYPEQRQHYRTLLQKQGSVRSQEVQIRTKAGVVKTVLLSAAVQMLEGQNCVIVMYLDISDRKATELELQQSEARYRAIVEDQTELIVRSLPDLSRTFVNDAYCRYFNVRREQVIGKSYLSLIDAADRESVVQLIRSLSPTNPNTTTENRVIANGALRWTQWSNRLLFDEQGVTEIQSVGRDITELKQTEAALRESEANLRQAQRIAHLGSWEFDPVTEQLSWSEELFRIVGLDPSQPEPARAEFLEMIPAADRVMLETVVERAFAEGTAYEVEHCIRRPDGTLRYLISKGEVMLRQQQVVKLFGTALDITERKQAELALQASETRFQEMTQTLNQVFYVISVVTGQYLYISPAYERLWGYSCESLYQNPRSWLDRIHPEDLEYVSGGFNQLLSGNRTRLQYRISCANGEVRWIESDSLVVRDENGNPLRVVGLADDITQRKQLEQTLQEREAMLRAIGDNLPKGFIYQYVHEPGKGSYYSYVSAGIERLLGIKPEAVLKNPQLMRSIGFEEDLAIADQVMQKSLQTLSPIELQMRNRTAEGKIQWSSIRSVPRRLEDGRTVWDGVEVDITDLKRTEAALRQSEEQFRRAFDDAPIGISLISATGHYIKVNAYYCSLLGYTEAELLNLTFQAITHPADLEADIVKFQQMIAGEIHSCYIEKRYITKQGTTVPVLLSAASIRDQDGRLLYVVGHIQDIRDRLKIERMKDEFISVTSHELRTPLTSIRGALGILESGVFNDRPEKAQHMLRIAISNSNRLVRLVDDILSLERLGSGQVQLVMEHCQVAELMQQAIDSVQALADQAGVFLSAPLLTASLWAAPDAVVQTLANLLSNAIKFSASGHTIWLNAEIEQQYKLESSPFLLFTVQDQGRGIPEDKLEVIFEQFQQVDASDSREKGGTGLGLAICKKIVQQHGGQIWAESRLGEGSTFYVALPLNLKDRIQLNGN